VEPVLDGTSNWSPCASFPAPPVKLRSCSLHGDREGKDASPQMLITELTAIIKHDMLR